MIWELIAKLWKHMPNRQPDVDAARRAKVEANRKLAEAKRMWPQTHEVSDKLSEWIESAMRGNR